MRAVERVVRARQAGRAIVDEAERRGAEIIVLGAPRGRHKTIFGAHRRLRPEERAVPRDGRRGQEGGGKACTGRCVRTIACGDDRDRARDARRSRCAHGFGVGVILGAALHRRRRRAPADAAEEGGLVARKLPGLQRELDARALFSVAYGEIASSIYFALGVVAAHALGFTPLVLLDRRRALPDRLALLRGRDGRAAGDGRRGDLRPPRDSTTSPASSQAGRSSSTT